MPILELFGCGMSLENRMYKSGLRTLPCGVPAAIEKLFDSVLDILIWPVLLRRKLEHQRVRTVGIGIRDSL